MLKDAPTALVLDDDKNFLAAADVMLSSAGLRTVLTHNIRDFDGALRDRPEYVFIDLVMPDFDGVQTISLIRARHPEAKVVIISAADVNIIRAVELFAERSGLRCLGMLKKPFWLDEVVQLIKGSNETVLLPSGIPILTSDKVESLLRMNRVAIEYQPKINVAWGTVMGFEALVRLKDANRLLQPAQFIDAAESPKLAALLTKRVLETTLSDMQRWRVDYGLTPKVSINLPMPVLEYDRLPDLVSKRVRKAGVAPKCLVFEVTERSVSDYFLSVLKVAIRMRLAGFGLSIDDYGTGFSSEERLRRLPFSELKLDISMIARLDHPEVARQIRRAIALSNELSLDLVAEGVETEQQKQALLAMGCECHQGFFYCHPLSNVDTPHWIRRYRSQSMKTAASYRNAG